MHLRRSVGDVLLRDHLQLLLDPVLHHVPSLPLVALVGLHTLVTVSAEVRLHLLGEHLQPDRVELVFEVQELGLGAGVLLTRPAAVLVEPVENLGIYKDVGATLFVGRLKERVEL